MEKDKSDRNNSGIILPYRPRHFVKKYAIFLDKSNTLIIHQVACYCLLVARYWFLVKIIDLPAKKPAGKSAGFYDEAKILL